MWMRKNRFGVGLNAFDRLDGEIRRVADKWLRQASPTFPDCVPAAPGKEKWPRNRFLSHSS
jgi:hypothetical protein